MKHQEEIRRLPDGELEVMLVIWHSDLPLHTGEIFQGLPEGRKNRIQSVQIILSRLAEKGFIEVEKVGRLNYYTALIGEEDYRRQETSSFIDRLYGSSPARLVATLVENGGIDGDELKEIRRLLEGGGDDA